MLINKDNDNDDDDNVDDDDDDYYYYIRYPSVIASDFVSQHPSPTHGLREAKKVSS